jgi:hypothetical protein
MFLGMIDFPISGQSWDNVCRLSHAAATTRSPFDASALADSPPGSGSPVTDTTIVADYGDDLLPRTTTNE